MIDKIMNVKKPMSYAFEADGVVLNLMEHDDNFPYIPRRQVSLRTAYHTHSWYELFYVEEGILHAYVGGEELLLEKGALFLVAPGVEHYTAIDETEGAARFRFNFALRFKKETELAAELAQLFAFDAYKLLLSDSTTHTRIRMLAEAMAEERVAAAGCYLLSLLLSAFTLMRKQKDHGRFDDTENNRIYKIESICQAYFTEKGFSLSILAEELHLSERQVERIIKRQYGINFRTYITSLRMKEARAILDAGTPVASVADTVGYASLSAFHRAFRLHFGRSPREYIAEKKKTPIAN